MKKAEIVERVAGEAGITKQAAQAAVGGVFDAIAEALARGEDPGFEVKLDARRREAVNDNEAAEHGVMLRGAIRW